MAVVVVISRRIRDVEGVVEEERIVSNVCPVSHK